MAEDRLNKVEERVLFGKTLVCEGILGVFMNYLLVTVLIFVPFPPKNFLIAIPFGYMTYWAWRASFYRCRLEDLQWLAGNQMMAHLCAQLVLSAFLAGHGDLVRDILAFYLSPTNPHAFNTYCAGFIVAVVNISAIAASIITYRAYVIASEEAEKDRANARRNQ